MRHPAHHRQTIRRDTHHAAPSPRHGKSARLRKVLMEEFLEVGLQSGRRLIGITTLLEHVEMTRTSNENDDVRALPNVIKTFVRVCRKLKPQRRRGLDRQ